VLEPRTPLLRPRDYRKSGDFAELRHAHSKSDRRYFGVR
jgi:hypothetical protein